MKQKIDLKSLIAELEQAKEGSRELSDRVLLAVGWLGQSASSKVAGILVPHWKSPDGRDVLVDLRPCPTTSIDAALTLVPEGFAIEDFMIWPGHPASLTILGTHKDGDKYWHNSSDGRWKGEAVTPPLALCIAALKARDAA